MIGGTAERPLIQLTCRDTGIGMDDETQASLFTPFMQADASTTRRFGGTGLGLAIVHQIVSMWGGSVRCDSAPGSGSTFTITITMTMQATHGSTPVPVEPTPATALPLSMSPPHTTHAPAVTPTL